MNEAVRVRAEIVELLRRELIGPDPQPEHTALNNGEEILRPQDPPRLRYSAGVLFPDRAPLAEAEEAHTGETESADSGPAEGDEPVDVSPQGAAADTDDEAEHEVNRANEFLPSAMGITALLRLPRQLKVTVRAGRYIRKVQDGVGRLDRDGHWQPHHWRQPVAPPAIPVSCEALRAAGATTQEYDVDTGTPDQKMSLHIYSRPYAHAQDAANDRIVTFTLINRTRMTGASPRDSECFFQCEFAVEDAAGSACFLEYPERRELEEDDEERSLALLYRHRRTFAVGHGCAAAWTTSADGKVARITTDTLPAYEMKPVLPREIAGVALSMGILASDDEPAAIRICEELAQAYREWIDSQRTVVSSSDFPLEHQPAALRHLDLCEECLRRIVDGIDLLRCDPDSRLAFAWMNEAMLLQQLHYDLAANHRRDWTERGGTLVLSAPYIPPDITAPPPGKGRWRPFQLAFILMNLRSIADRNSPERAVADLIWFPTGGGKTEAYLGLTAFSIFRRRLLHRDDAGTAVLMRYTLRLLTTQQFQRAASLICACECIRSRQADRLGDVRISIGLWVGQDVTPNRNTNAVAALNNLLQNGTPNPFVVLTCPWCGAAMGPVEHHRAYQAKGYLKRGPRVIFRCEDPQCEFSRREGLPLMVVDEAIYQERPTLLIGTVDKFAMLPWNPEARGLFGLDAAHPVSPPDLIIQDELHLISGALGSMVGMYESTVDALCRGNQSGTSYCAKLVASTATICRAEQQTRSLYARPVFIFPPQGLRAGDSFFAEEAVQDQEGRPVPGRLYVGVFASALSSHVTAQIRVMSALLQAARSIDAPTDAVDPYWTLVAYFNSLRELGHAATLIRADIREYLNAVWDRLNIRRPAPGSNEPDRRRFINRDLELTSRIQSSQVTDVLQQMFNPYPGTTDRRPVDVCLATNMIQVGLDVPRLGLMTVVGQPKTTSEYIQATSRVGRDVRGPGLVAAVYNPAKPRDRSHFEHFRSYHQSIYRWVEPTSVTPFAVPVRERALHAQLVTLVRYWGDAASQNRPTPVPPDALLERTRGILTSRVQAVDPGEFRFADQMLRDFVLKWQRLLPPIYGQFGPPPPETPLMYPSGTEPRTVWAGRSKSTPTSMRNVDSSCDAEVIAQFPQP